MKYLILAIALVTLFVSTASATYYVEGTHLSSLDSQDDESSGALDIGFQFPFYTENYTQFYVTTNGIVSFGGADGTFSNTALPSSSYTYPSVFPFWDDLMSYNEQQNILYTTVASGESGNPYGTNVTIVQWTNYGFFDSELVMGTFQVHLVSNGNITFNYNNLVAPTRAYGQETTIGIQENGSGNYVQHSYNEDAGVRSGYAINFAYDDGSNYVKSDVNTDGFWDILLYKTGSVQPPSKPSNPSPSVGATTSTSPTLSWSCDNATNYTVRVSVNSDLSSPSTNITTTPSLALSGLSEDTTYYWHVIATNDGGETHSDLWNFTTGSVPVASFTSNVTSGAIPLAVSFTDTSTNSPTSWQWDFGDGNTSLSQNPTHVYVTPGTYNVSLNVTNADGSDIITETDYITAAFIPVANFTSNVTEGIVPLSVNFTDLSQNSPTSWSWDFGDGNTSTDQNPTYVYASAGTYNVSLNVTNVGGSNVSTLENYITVTFLATTVNASYTSITYDENDNMTVDPGIIVNGSSTFTSARVYIGDGYVENEDFLRFTNTSSINGSFDSLTGILSLSGSGNAADYQEAFRNVRYENIEDNPDTSGRNITFVLGGNTLYSEDTGHYYEYVTYTSTWEQAKTNAETKTMEGMQGYLATITSEEENNFLMQKIQADAWIGANDSIVEGDWRWVTGPEGTEDSGNGRLFYRGTGTSGTIINGEYNKWNGPIWGGGEPNNAGNEDGAQMYSSNNGTWNDLPTTGTTLSGYLLEYGGMPDETAPQLTATITVNINSINDAPGMPGNFSTPLEGASVERGSTVNVSWGESTDLEEDSLVYDLWYFNGTWGQIAGMLNVTSYEFTIPIDDLSEAMFKVYANDSVDSSPENNVTFTLTSFVPVANFSVNLTSGIAPQTVNFTDMSSNYPNGWVWDFGDGNTSTDQNPIHTYVSAGTYNVSLNASNPAGSNISIQTDLITVIDTPVANFTSNVTSGAVPLIVSFTDTSNNDPTSWLWDFGDGNTSTEQDTTHTYVSAGIYNISLNATNLAGSDVTTQTAYINAYITPVANFTADVTSGTAPLSVSFTDLSTNTPTSWLWDFGDGSNSTEQGPTHSYTVAGSYNVTLNATNVAGSNVSVQTDYITVSAASTSSDSSHRTSVGPSMEPETVSTSDTSVRYVMGGTRVEFDLSAGDDPVVAITFDAKDNEGLVVTKVQVLKERPSDVPAPQGTSYSLMSIDVGAVGTISEDNADNLWIQFKVSRQWIEENNIDISTIRMSRYHGEQWNDLPTYQEREDDEYIYFYAETPGFSIFEVVGDEITTVSEQVPASSPATEEESVPEDMEKKDYTFVFVVLGLLVIVSVAYIVSRKQKSE